MKDIPTDKKLQDMLCNYNTKEYCGTEIVGFGAHIPDRNIRKSNKEVI